MTAFFLIRRQGGHIHLFEIAAWLEKGEISPEEDFIDTGQCHGLLVNLGPVEERGRRRIIPDIDQGLANLFLQQGV
jgi:hypothetical protein